MAHLALLALACLLISFLPQSNSLHAPTPISHDFKKPAFIGFLPELGRDIMTVTSFDILCSNCKLSLVNTTTMESTILASLNWPNAATFCPESVCSKPSLLVGFGFLAPGHSTGGVAIVALDGSGHTIITQEKKGWFYHRALLFDVNGDGTMDIVTARATVPGKEQQVKRASICIACVIATQGELVVLLGPSFKSEKVLVSGPDFLFRIYDLAGDGALQVVAAEFYTKRFVYYHFDPATLAPSTTVIDSDLGAGFDCQVTDLNNDGLPDVLVTNHEPSGSVFAFEISILPNFTAVATKHTLASNITIHKSIVPSPGAAAPGEATSFQPPNQGLSGVNASKPWIAVAGDGQFHAMVLKPRSENSSDWAYDLSEVIDCGGTVGQIGIQSSDSQTSEVTLWIPCYDTNKIVEVRL